MSEGLRDSGPPGAEAIARRLCEGGLLLACAGFALLGLGHLVNHALFDGDVWNLNPATEGNAWTWASSSAVLAASFAVLLRTLAVDERRLYYGALAVALAFFSLDDAVEVHEKLGRAVGVRLLDSAPGYVQNRVWLALYVPLLVFVAVALWRESSGAHRARRTIRLGLILLVAAIASEAVGFATKPLERRGITWPDLVRLGVEEGVELAGWIVVAAGLTALTTLAVAASATPGGAGPGRA